MPSCPPDIEDCLKIEEHDRRRKWYLNRGVSVDTLLTLVVMFVGFAVWLSNHEGRMVKQEESVKHLDEMDKQILLKVGSERTEMRDDIKEIKEQVNKLVERRR